MGAYLTNLLGTSRGAFQFQFDWIALRFGLDENELVVSNFVWKNPPRFIRPGDKDSKDYFVRVRKLLVRFSMDTVYRAIVNGDCAIKIYYAEIDHLMVNIEKGLHGEGLNLWAALGADNVEQEKSVETSVLHNVVVAMSATATASNEVFNTVLQYNPASVIYRQFISLTGGSSKQGSAAGDGKADSTSMASDGKGRRGHADADDDDGHNEHDRKNHNDDEDDNDDDDDDGHDDENLTEHHDETEQDGSAVSSSSSAGTMMPGAEEAAASASGNTHWGVPYKLDVDVFLVRDLQVFAQDFLNAEHTEGSANRAIKVALMDMRRKELTDRSRKKGETRRGKY